MTTELKKYICYRAVEDASGDQGFAVMATDPDDAKARAMRGEGEIEHNDVEVVSLGEIHTVEEGEIDTGPKYSLSDILKNLPQTRDKHAIVPKMALWVLEKKVDHHHRSGKTVSWWEPVPAEAKHFWVGDGNNVTEIGVTSHEEHLSSDLWYSFELAKAEADRLNLDEENND